MMYESCGEVSCRCDRRVQGGGGSASRTSSEPLLVALVMDRLTDDVRQESPWTMMFADDIVIFSESREQREEHLERWRNS